MLLQHFHGSALSEGADSAEGRTGGKMSEKHYIASEWVNQKQCYEPTLEEANYTSVCK